MGFYLSGLPFPSPGDLLNPGIKPGLLHYRQILYHPSHQGNGFITLPGKRGTLNRLVPQGL